jgi:hypothetical protein
MKTPFDSDPRWQPKGYVWSTVQRSGEKWVLMTETQRSAEMWKAQIHGTDIRWELYTYRWTGDKYGVKGRGTDIRWDLWCAGQKPIDVRWDLWCKGQRHRQQTGCKYSEPGAQPTRIETQRSAEKWGVKADDTEIGWKVRKNLLICLIWGRAKANKKIKKGTTWYVCIYWKTCNILSTVHLS